MLRCKAAYELTKLGVLDILYTSGDVMLTQIRSFFSATRSSPTSGAGHPGFDVQQELEIDATLSARVQPSTSPQPSIAQDDTAHLQPVDALQGPQAPSQKKPSSRRKKVEKNAGSPSKPRSSSFSNFRGSDWVLPGTPEAPKNLVLNSLNSFSGS